MMKKGFIPTIHLHKKDKKSTETGGDIEAEIERFDRKVTKSSNKKMLT